jgi:sulfoxide reductase heme-binding subunit YedZ
MATMIVGTRRRERRQRVQPAYWLGLALAGGIELATRLAYGHDGELWGQRVSEAHAHASLTLLFLALAARPLARRWPWPLRNSRALGVLAFLYAAAHSIYAFAHSLGADLVILEFASPATRYALLAGTASLLLLLPLFLTSNDTSQRLLRRRWTLLHSLAPAALILAALHTAWIGVHYGLQPLAPASLALAATLIALLAARRRRKP